MHQDTGFLRAIREDPDDDGPRLVYADWLEERGDPRAEFVRAQCEHDGLPEGDGRRADLEATSLRLLRSHGKGWAGPIRRLVKGWTFRRGFVEGIKVRAEDFLAHAVEIFEAAPIRHVQLLGAGGQIDALAACPHLAHLRSLDIGEAFLRGPGEAVRDRRRMDWSGHYERSQAARLAAQERGAILVRRLLDSPHLTGLRALSLENNRLGLPGVRALTRSRVLGQLTFLDLRRNDMGVEAVRLLADPALLGELRTLRLGYCRNEDPDYDNDDEEEYSRTPAGYVNYDEEGAWEFGPGGNNFPRGPIARMLSPFASRLEGLEAGACQITSLGMQDFKDRPEGLARLSLHHNPIGLPGVRALAASPLIGGLKALDLASCYVDDEAARVLSGCPGLAGLTELDLGNHELGPDGVRAITGATFAAGLTKLDLAGSSSTHRTGFGIAGLQALAEGAESLPNLAWLDLRKDDLNPAAARVLAGSPLLGRLAWLDLRGNRLGDDGARTLAAVGPWPRLAWLDVRDNQIGPAAREALRKAFGPLVRFGPDRSASSEDEDMPF